MLKKFLSPILLVKRRFVIMILMTLYTSGLAVFSVKVLQFAADAMVA